MSLKEEIHRIDGCLLTENKELTSFTTFKLQSFGDLIEVTSIKALQELLPLLVKNKADYLVVGWGANQILPAHCSMFILHLNLPFSLNELENMKESYVLPASLGINHLTAHAIKHALKGWEVFTGIPASMGGAIYMNAGTNLGEFGSIVKKVKLVTPEGKIREEQINEKSFSYRKNHFVRKGEVIVEATLIHQGIDSSIPQKIKDYLDYRKRTQPLTTRNCGCVFKNPSKELQAGRLIDLLQLKGIRAGDLRISPKHGNFMENTGKANWDQFKSLVELIDFEMDHFYGIEFELEVKIPYH